MSMKFRTSRISPKIPKEALLKLGKSTIEQLRESYEICRKLGWKDHHLTEIYEMPSLDSLSKLDKKSRE